MPWPLSNSPDSTVSRVRAWRLENRLSIPGEGRDYFLTASRPVLTPTQPCVQCYPGGSVPGIRRSVFKADFDRLPLPRLMIHEDVLPLCCACLWSGAVSPLPLPHPNEPNLSEGHRYKNSTGSRCSSGADSGG